MIKQVPEKNTRSCIHTHTHRDAYEHTQTVTHHPLLENSLLKIYYAFSIAVRFPLAGLQKQIRGTEGNCSGSARYVNKSEMQLKCVAAINKWKKQMKAKDEEQQCFIASQR